LNIQNWEVDQAFSAGDIIWTEINKGKTRSWIVKLLLSLLPTILSAAVVGGVVYVDQTIKYEQNLSSLTIFTKYLLSLLLCLFNYYFLPHIIFKIV